MPPAKSCLSAAVGSLHAERAFELSKRCVARRRRLRAPGVPEGADDDPVGAGDQPVGGGVVGVDEQVGEPGVVAAEGKGVSVEQHDAGDLVRVREPGGCRDAGAERVADEDGALEVEACSKPRRSWSQWAIV